MKLLMVNLIAIVRDGLDRVAALKQLTFDEAFGYELRNGIKVYSGLELGGTVQLADSLGNLSWMRLSKPRTPRRWRLRRREMSRDNPEFATFEMVVQEATLRTIEELAALWGFTVTDMINRVLQTACEVDVRLTQDGCAWLRDSEGVAVGRIIFD